MSSKVYSKKKTITKEQVETRVLERFRELEDNKVFLRYFSSYDFNENEKQMLEDWSQILEFYFESVFESLGLSVDDILSYSKFKGKKPIGLPNILIDLHNKGDYLTDSDINDDNYYRKNYPQFYQHENTWGNYIKKGIIGVGSYALSFVYSNQQDEFPALKDDEIVFNTRIFKSHCIDNLYELLKEHLEANDTSVITVKNFKLLINENKIKYGDSYLDLCLTFLSKIKRIGLFEIGYDKEKVQCIKLYRNEDDSITKQDEAKMSLSLQIDALNKKSEDIQAKIKEVHEKSKECLKKGEREMAKNWLKREKMLEKNRNNYLNVLNMLEGNLMDLNSAESTMKVKDILVESSKVYKQLMIDPDKFDELTEDLKTQEENLGEIKNIIGNYADEKIDSTVDDEISALETELKGGQDALPNVQKEKVKKEEVPKEEVKENNKKDQYADKSKEDLDAMLENLEGA